MYVGLVLASMLGHKIGYADVFPAWIAHLSSQAGA